MSLVVIDEGTSAVVAGTSVVPATYATVEKCILPRSIAVMQGATTKVAIACAGENNAQVFDAFGRPAGTRRSGDLPSTIVVDDSTQKLVAWSQMTRTLSVSTDPTASSPGVSARGGPLATPISRGRRLFYDVSGKVAADGRACASCHTDGREDGLVWSTPEGARQTPMLAGRIVGTAPYGWTRNARTFSEYVSGTITRLRGHGFSASELADLEAYVVSLKPPHAASADTTVVDHGRQIFASQGCGGCHSGASSTDNASHPIGGIAIATPSLHYVTGTAPYFHDGRYKDLRTLLTSSDPDMGSGRALPSTDLDALESYVRSL
jgi:mono/diheme cytochrome c family protein